MAAVEQKEQADPANPIPGIPSVTGTSLIGLTKDIPSSVTELLPSLTELPSSAPELPKPKEEHPIPLEVAVVKKIEIEDELKNLKKECGKEGVNIKSLHSIRPDLREYVVMPHQTKAMDFGQRDGNMIKWDDTQYLDKIDGASHTLKMQFDVSHYIPEDVKVVIADGILRILAVHEEKTDNQRTKRQYRREFLLPKGVNPYQVSATISLDGVLTVEAPLPIDEVTDLDEPATVPPVTQRAQSKV